MHRAMDAILALRHHPHMLKELSAERAKWLLYGLEHMVRMPFADRDMLFDLQLRLTLHLLDVQVQRLHRMTLHMKPYRPYAPAYRKPMAAWDHKWMDWDRAWKKPHDHGYYYSPYRPVLTVKRGMLRLPHMLGIKVKEMAFRSGMSCHLAQASATRHHAWDRDIFVGPCKQEGHIWTFNVWHV
jgi:hypothetical protein